jgi:hypothetical protein
MTSGDQVSAHLCARRCGWPSGPRTGTGGGPRAELGPSAGEFSFLFLTFLVSFFYSLFFLIFESKFEFQIHGEFVLI